MLFWPFGRKKEFSKEDLESWLLLPLGNPGDEYANTRHNLGRLMLQQWVKEKALPPEPIHEFPSGTLYGAGQVRLLVSATYMNLSGQVVAEAMKAGFDPARMILFYDDKDLELGAGRFRLKGSAGGHNGVASVTEAAGMELPRLRLGIGPFERPLHEFVLGEWRENEWATIHGMAEPFGAFMDRLLKCQTLDGLSGWTRNSP